MTSRSAWEDSRDHEDGAAERAFKPLTREEAQAWRATQRPMSPWHLVAAQAVAALAMVVLSVGIWRDAAVSWSVFYGALVVVLPAALMAWGITRRPPSADRGAVLGFLVWEGLKIGAAVVLLVMAPWVLKPVHWPALLGAMVLCLKVNWVTLLRRGRTKQTSETKE